MHIQNLHAIIYPKIAISMHYTSHPNTILLLVELYKFTKLSPLMQFIYTTTELIVPLL